MKSIPFFLSFLMFFLFRILYPAPLFSRDAPITEAGSANPCPGSSINIPVTVDNFINVTAITLRLEYDSTLLFYTSNTTNPQLGGMFVNVVRVSPTSRFYKVLVVWSNTTPTTLPDGSPLLTLTFTYLTGNDSIRFNNTVGGGGACEYADENGNPMNDLPTSNFYHNGPVIDAGPGAAGTITGPNAVCLGSAGIAYSVPPVTNASGYFWTLPPGASIASGENSNAITVDFAPDANSGVISVHGTNECGNGLPSAPFPIDINPLPTAALSGSTTLCAGDDALIQVDLTGSPPWNITYTDGTAPVTIEGINSTPHNFNVSPPFTTTYWLTTVSDGNLCTGTGTGSALITVNPLPTATITGLTTICAGSAAPIQVDLTGMPPWNITYTDGTTPVNIDGITSSPFSFMVSPEITTTYLITTVSDGNSCTNTGLGMAYIIVNPIPDTPVITADGNLLTSNAPIGNQWYYEGSGLIPGATGQTYTVTNNTGYYWCTVTLEGCTSLSSNWEWIVVTTTTDPDLEVPVTLFPVPNQGTFKLSLSASEDKTWTVRIFNQMGSEILQLKNLIPTDGKIIKEIDLGPVSNGIYTIILQNGQQRVVRKMLIIK